jgi:hypothetical protein
MRTIHLSAVLVLGLLLPATAQAQGGYSKAPPSPGEEVIVTQSTSGVELRGRIVELSKTNLAILVNGTRVDVQIDNVLRIDARTDSVKNGALIGGGVFFGMAALSCALYYDDAGQCAGGIALNTLFGTLAGAGIDALIRGRTTIYSKPASTALTVAPTRKGVRAQFTLRW